LSDIIAKRQRLRADPTYRETEHKDMLKYMLDAHEEEKVRLIDQPCDGFGPPRSCLSSHTFFHPAVALVSPCVWEKLIGTPPQVAADTKTLVDNLITILFGGFDTSSITLTYALYMMTQHRDVERRVVEEVLRYSRVAHTWQCENAPPSPPH